MKLDRPLVLVVDDEPNGLAVIEELLKPDCQVRVAETGMQAIRQAGIRPLPDLILLDVMMPGMDGYRVLTDLRASALTADIPVMFITALGSQEDQVKGLALGAVDYITKPIEPSVLLARVRTHLELKRVRDRLSAQNAQLEARVAERTQSLEKALEQVNGAHAALRRTHFDMLHAISEFMELRGGGLGMHSRRVAQMARQLAQGMGLDEGETQEVFVAALLHDVGKIGFSDELLSRPFSQLHGEDLQCYHAHPAHAAAALKGIPSLAGVAAIIRGHHEHFDGTGFPDGLSGFEIPLGARIIAAASDYDNLKTGMLTTLPMTARQRHQFLVDGRNRRYDPQVIDAFEAQLSQDEQGEIDQVRIAAAHLQENMVLSADVMHPDGFLLLSRGTIMTRRLIDQMAAVDREAGGRLDLHVYRLPSLHGG